MRRIVDTCLSADLRIKRIKQEEKEAKEAKKKGRDGTPQSQKAKEEEKKKAEEEAKRMEEEEKVREIAFILFQPVSQRRRLLGSKQRRIKPRLPTRQRRLAGQHESQQSSRPVHNARWRLPSSR